MAQNFSRNVPTTPSYSHLLMHDAPGSVAMATHRHNEAEVQEACHLGGGAPKVMWQALCSDTAIELTSLAVYINAQLINIVMCVV